MSKVLIVPDIHGRDFWINPCHEYIDQVDKCIFLGDYHDPYPEQVTKDRSLNLLQTEFIPFVEKHRNKIICLEGNHDEHYISERPICRFDYSHSDNIKEILQQLNLQLTYKIDDIIFSHAGILPEWLEMCNLHIDKLNDLPLNSEYLEMISHYRGGFNRVGSCIWADVIEYAYSTHLANIYQVFGHSQLQDKPIIESDFADLDCRKVFIMDTSSKQITQCVEPI